nr:hypothetical protein [Aliarcobacter cryaerophilus]
MIAIKKALNDGMSKAAICRTFEVKRSTLIDSLNRKKWGVLEISCQSDKIISRIDNGTTNRF